MSLVVVVWVLPPPLLLVRVVPPPAAAPVLYARKAAICQLSSILLIRTMPTGMYTRNLAGCRSSALSAKGMANRLVAPWLYSSPMPTRSASVLMLSAASLGVLAMVISMSPGSPFTSRLLMVTILAWKSTPCSLSITRTSLPGM